MKANEFIKVHGIEKAREIVEGAPSNAYSSYPKQGVYAKFIFGKCGNDEVLLSEHRRLETIT